METTRLFEDTDRYAFDMDVCRPSRGWAQVDTSQDASYYGNWSNPFELITVSFAEGDVCINKCETAAEFRAEMIKIHDWHVTNGYKFGVDSMLKKDIEQAFVYLGLGGMLH